MAWEKQRQWSPPKRSLAHRLDGDGRTICGAIVPGPADPRADRVMRGDEIPPEVRECLLCIALDQPDF